MTLRILHGLMHVLGAGDLENAVIGADESPSTVMYPSAGDAGHLGTEFDAGLWDPLVVEGKTQLPIGDFRFFQGWYAGVSEAALDTPRFHTWKPQFLNGQWTIKPFGPKASIEYVGTFRSRIYLGEVCEGDVIPLALAEELQENMPGFSSLVDASHNVVVGVREKGSGFGLFQFEGYGKYHTWSDGTLWYRGAGSS